MVVGSQPYTPDWSRAGIKVRLHKERVDRMRLSSPHWREEQKQRDGEMGRWSVDERDEDSGKCLPHFLSIDGGELRMKEIGLDTCTCIVSE